jgi:hypothetical protein
MFKAILFFILVWVLVVLGINLFRAATNKERLSAVKVGAFGLVTAIIAVTFVALMVVIF